MIGDNALPALAERIRMEHRATADALAASIKHAMAAGDALLEAKALVPHGQWLAWLAANCEMSERTAQLYMRIAKNREGVEMQIRNGVADLTLNEATALLFLTSDIKKLLSFAAQLQKVTDPEDVLKVCLENDVGVFHDQNYSVCYGCSDEQKREWTLYILFLMNNVGYSSVENAAGFVEWLRQRPFLSVDEWLGHEGFKFRGICRMSQLPQEHIRAWDEYAAANAALSLESIEAELMATEDRTTLPPPIAKQKTGRRRKNGVGR